jgi:hypothetical protein
MRFSGVKTLVIATAVIPTLKERSLPTVLKIWRELLFAVLQIVDKMVDAMTSLNSMLC